MSGETAGTPCGEWIAALASRRPTPGGGGAAAVAAALGAAAGAMAARYTTGKRWADRAERATALAERLTALAESMLEIADEDAAAFAALQASWRETDLGDDRRSEIEDRARAVPATILTRCGDQIEAMADFLEACNPQIASDAKVAIHLLAGAGRAAWQTLLVNHPDRATRDRARVELARLEAAEARAMADEPPGE